MPTSAACWNRPLIDVNQATRAATAVLEQQGFGKPVRDFVGVITANRRLRNLRAIVTAFAALVAQRRGIITAHVATAHPLNDVQRQQLRARLIEAGYGNVNILESGANPICSAVSSCASAPASTTHP